MMQGVTLPHQLAQAVGIHCSWKCYWQSHPRGLCLRCYETSCFTTHERRLNQISMLAQALLELAYRHVHPLQLGITNGLVLVFTHILQHLLVLDEEKSKGQRQGQCE